MTLTDIVKNGKLTFKKDSDKFIVEYSGYNEYGTATTHSFTAKSLRIAYLKLEEYLKYSVS